MIRNIDSLVTRVKDIMEILLQRSHDDKHEHDYQMAAGNITLEDHRYEIVIRLEQKKSEQPYFYAGGSSVVGYDTLKFNPINNN